MPYCNFCHEFFARQTWSSPEESCECGLNTSVEDLRDDYFNHDREPSEDELDAKRAEKR